MEDHCVVVTAHFEALFLNDGSVRYSVNSTLTSYDIQTRRGKYRFLQYGTFKEITRDRRGIYL